MGNFFSFLPSFSTAMSSVMALSFVIPISFAVYLYINQSSIIYPAAFPEGSRKVVDTPDKYGMDYEDVELKTPDGETLRCFFIPAIEKTKSANGNELNNDQLGQPQDSDINATDNDNDHIPPTLLYLHANAGNLGHRLPIAKVLFETLNCNVFMLSYRG